MPSRDINDLQYGLQHAYIELRERYMRSFSGRDLILVCTYRSPQEQAELYQSGRSKPGPILTNCDGVRKMSQHNVNPSRAFDVGVIDGGKYRGDEAAYAPLGDIAKDLGIIWGGSWKRLKDFCHFQAEVSSNEGVDAASGGKIADNCGKPIAISAPTSFPANTQPVSRTGAKNIGTMPGRISRAYSSV